MRQRALYCGVAVALASSCGRRESATPAPAAPGTGAVTTLIPTEADEHLTSVPALLQGRVPGLEVRSLPNGQYTLRIRGGEPLLVIDGAPVPQRSLGTTLAGMDVRDVARIDVLKDAEAASMWGPRGANGVIVITTKRAR